jgi:hypothetical protein
MPTREETREQTRERIIALAERLARRERFDPSWITYPRWAGSAPDLVPILEKADKFKKWAKAILEGELPPPPWLAEEDPAFRDPELNKPPENPNHLSAAARRRIKHRRFACRIELVTPLPGMNALPRPKQRPGKEAIIDLARRLDDSPMRLPLFFYHYPKWASYPPQYAPGLERVARLKRQAERILNGEERPPPWLVAKEPERWMPKREVKTAPAPAQLAEADACLQRRSYPLLAAWLLFSASPSPPLPARPPPLMVWRQPLRSPGDACPGLPPAREREKRSVSRDMLFDNRIAVVGNTR